jgi:hypothetical protein
MSMEEFLKKAIETLWYLWRVKLLERWRVTTMIRTDIVIATVIGAMFAASPARAQVNVEQIVAQKVQAILPKNGSGGGLRLPSG